MHISTTDPQDELLTEVDKNNIVIGSIKRKLAHNNPDIFYRTIYVIVKNEEDKVLIQKRSKTKDLYPNCWDLSVGGHVNFGDGYVKTAVRELDEELHLKVFEKDLNFLGEVLVKLPKSNEYFHVFGYSLKNNHKINTKKEEIENIKYMTIEEIKQSMKSKSLKWYPRPIQIIEALF
jgi:isopentenyldiphosphate isomerase